jgi:hypothetical protein
LERGIDGPDLDFDLDLDFDRDLDLDPDRDPDLDPDRDRDLDIDLDLDADLDRDVSERGQGRAAESASRALRQRPARRSGLKPSSVMSFTRFARGERHDRRRAVSTSAA